MDISRILEQLNEPQRTAVTSEAKNLLVLAGAGSGKTRVLAHRIVWAVEHESVSPYSILAVTFTNKAAGEMKQRIHSLLARPANGMWIGTFHGIAHRILKAHWSEAKLPENFQILDSEDQLRLIKRSMKALNIDDKKWQPKSVQIFINDQKDEGLRPDKVDVTGDPYRRTYLQVYEHYEEVCRRSGLVDFAELLLRAYEIWQQTPSLLNHYRDRFRYILIDEFQDTNTIQYQWVKLLVSENNKITIVGDDDQSIYGWRGAKVENIHNFAQVFSPCETIRLEQNYRSTQMILSAANALIENNSGRLGKELWSEGNEGEPISLYSAYNEIDESRFIVERIKHAVEVEDVNYRDIAILYRSNAQSRVIEESLIRSDMPYRIYGGLRFFERAEIKNALAYMRLIHSDADDPAFERVVNLPTRGIGERTLEAIRRTARDEKITLYSAAAKVVDSKQLPSRASNAVKGFIDLIETIKESAQALSLWELVEHVIAETKLIEFHQKERGEKAKARIENLKELVTAAKFYEVEEGEPLVEFLGHAALESGEGQASPDQDCVQLMTLHSAKGLEFSYVFLVGMEEGLFPSQMSFQDGDRLEEERRLCYVGITRAMKKLYLSHAESRRIYGDERRPILSRFVREIPQEYIQEVRINATVSRPALTRSSEHDDDYADDAFFEGRRVMHAIFGEGTVLQISGQGAYERVQVKFDKEGEKWLRSTYAKLEPIITA